MNRTSKPWRGLLAVAACLPAAIISCNPSRSEFAPIIDAQEMPPTSGPVSTRTKVVLLGTGTPNADPERMGPALAIVIDDKAYLVDCGPGIVRRAAAAHARGTKALAVSRLEHVFITHLHSDHTLGLPDLIFTPWVLERTAPLHVFGPPGTRRMVDHITDAWAEDVLVRLDGLQPANHTGHHVIVHEIGEGEVYRDASVTVTAFSVDHGSWEHAYGFRFVGPDRTVVVSGDTRPSERLVAASKGCDVLVHEVYSAKRFATIPPEWQRYHRAFHTSTTELAELASRIHPSLLILTHQLYWGARDAELVAEVKAGYSGSVLSGRDLGVY